MWLKLIIVLFFNLLFNKDYNVTLITDHIEKVISINQYLEELFPFINKQEINNIINNINNINIYNITNNLKINYNISLDLNNIQILNNKLKLFDQFNF